MKFIASQIDGSRCREISESTISDYYIATKLFCEMNDLSLAMKKVGRGLPPEGDIEASRISR
jgi:hypothetical protein